MKCWLASCMMIVSMAVDMISIPQAHAKSREPASTKRPFDMLTPNTRLFPFRVSPVTSQITILLTKGPGSVGPSTPPIALSSVKPKPFVPPKGMQRLYVKKFVHGNLEILAYRPVTDTVNPPTPSSLYVVEPGKGGKLYVITTVVDHDLASEPFAFSEVDLFDVGRVHYIAINQGVSLTPDAGGMKLILTRLVEPVQSGGAWQVSRSTRIIPLGGRIFKVGERLLVESGLLNDGQTYWYSFSRVGFSETTVRQAWPNSKSIPNSQTLTLHVKVTQSNGKQMVHIESYNPMSFQMKVGQILVIKEVGDPAPLGVLLTTPQDPGGFSTPLPSPYKRTLLYRVDYATPAAVDLEPVSLQNTWTMPKPGWLSIPFTVTK